MAFRGLLRGILSASEWLSDPWNINNARYTGNSYDASSTTLEANGLFFKSDGLSFWINGSGSVYEFSISSAWDLSSTVSFVRSYSYSSQDTTGRDVFFKSDGTKMFILGGQNDSVYEYALSTAWDVSSASYTTSYSVSSEEPVPRSLFFKSDGLKFYVIGASILGQKVYEYDLSTAWDLSTASYSNSSFDPSSEVDTPFSLTFKTDGTKMYITDAITEFVHQYTLSTAWDVTTASYDNKFLSVSAQSTAALNTFFRTNGENFYMVGNSDVVFQYEV